MLSVPRFRVAMLLLLCTLLQGQAAPAPGGSSPPPFTVTRGWLKMSDGVELSATYWIPRERPAHALPAVLEMVPYRKDDDFAIRDYPTWAYLARRGIVGVRVDVRGTGSSRGALPDREYSDRELADIPEIIAQLAAMPWSNGKIGMQGISWSAFNAMMTAMRRPPHLAGILVAHGSQDLFGNDIHYIDGALHLDVFATEMELENIVPRSPDYPLDANYFANRFDRLPWTFAYLKHQRDGAWWETGRSLQTDYGSVDVPVYAVAGLLDGYRDFAIAMLDHLHAPIKVQVGPWNHAWPNDGEPGPNYDFDADAADWWQQVLNGQKTGACCDPQLMVFVRGSVAPDADLKTTPGEFWFSPWPVRQIHWRQWYPQPNARLSTATASAAVDRMTYRPSDGAGTLNWWGETTPDMRAADRGSLVYDSAPLDRAMRILGNPKVTLRVSADAPLANWVVRLEDRRPDGSVSMVTGALRVGAQRNSRSDPAPLTPGQAFTLQFPLHFTTWTFERGHRVRLVVSNAQFPMMWPTPYAMTTTLGVGNGASELELPVLTAGELPAVKLRGPEAPEENPNGRWLTGESLTPFHFSVDAGGRATATAQESFAYEIDGRTISAKQHILYAADDRHPWIASFHADAQETIHVGGRTIELTSTIRIDSDRRFFNATIARSVYANGKLLRTRTWSEPIPRDDQ